MVYCEFLGSNYFTIILKYFIQTIWSFWIFFKERPDVVIVMSPPVFANIPAIIYSTIFRKQYIIDAHTGALVNPLWKNVRFLQKYLCRKANFTIVTNPAFSVIIESWGGRAIIIPDVLIKADSPVLPKLPDGYNVTLVNTFARDEPIYAFLEATKLLKNVNFHITGKLNNNRRLLSESVDTNVRFTDFLPTNEYHGLLLASDLIVVLTTKDNTMQRGAYEAIYLGKPVVTSNWKILRDNFPMGCVFVDNTLEGIAKGIQNGLDHLKNLTVEAQKMAEDKKIIWQENKKRIITEIELKLSRIRGK